MSSSSKVPLGSAVRQVARGVRFPGEATVPDFMAMKRSPGTGRNWGQGSGQVTRRHSLGSRGPWNPGQGPGRRSLLSSTRVALAALPPQSPLRGARPRAAPRRWPRHHTRGARAERPEPQGTTCPSGGIPRVASATTAEEP